MHINLRSEAVKDYPAIAEINTLAFSEKSGSGNIGKTEMLLVDVLRHAPDFDPDLSLVAEVDGRVAGHALFYPYRAFVQGEEIAATGLHPIATHPAYQKQGIGSALMLEGHRRLKEKGVVFSYLYGHPSYYPRFGYQTHLLGMCCVEIERENIPACRGRIEERQLEPADVEQVVAMWKTWFMDVPLAIFPGSSFLDWVAHFETFETSAVFIEGELRGFLRWRPDDPEKIRFFLAKDKEATTQMLGHLNQKYSHHPSPSLRIPVHPAAAATKNWLPCPYAGTADPWDAGMIKILDEGNQAIRTYCDSVRAGEQMVGLVIYPPYVDEAW
jgi:putative acetyltransferase